MKELDDRLLSAYIDNELSVSEIEEIEQQLSKDELQHLVNEKKLDSSIKNIIKEAPKCPDVLWDNILSEVDETPKDKPAKRQILFTVILSVAAAIVVFFGLNNGVYPAWVPKTVAELTQKSQVAMDRHSVNSFLATHGVKLELGDFPKTHHGNAVNLLGAAVEKIAGDEVVTLYFDCCGKPVKIFLMPNEGEASKFIEQQDLAGTDGIVENTVKGDYRLAIVSTHNASELVDSISAI
ncbi:MAG: hypothetical protein MK132_13905 [Lentisphaerales bacterium]|nr:hypothetical protein [Lentisphaerales bacterium]